MQVKAAELGLRAAVGLGTLAYRYLAPGNTTATTNRTVSMPPRSVYPARRIGGMRKAVRRFTRRTPVPRHVLGNDYLSLRRTTNLRSEGLVTGFEAGFADFKLEQVYTTDLINTFDVYRIRKIVCQFTPRVDAGNNGITNNNVMHCYTACDTIGEAIAPTAAIELCQYGNYKYSSVSSGQRHIYTYYPKVVNTVDSDGTSRAAGSYGMNPWLQFTATGISIPHKRLLWYVAASGGNSELPFDIVQTVYFDVKRLH